MAEGKFIGYVQLLEACREPGCPVCRCAIRDGRRYLETLLYEQVTDPVTRRALRASWGFCNWHTWMLLEIPHAVFGAAIIYEDILDRVLARAGEASAGADRSRRRGWLARLLGMRNAAPGRRGDGQRARCPTCAEVGDAERRYLDTLARLGHEGELEAAYARSDGLCAPHLFALVAHAGDAPGTRSLVARTRDTWRRLGRELGAFVAKHDYRNREPYTEAEAASCSRAFEILAGARGVFGNDAHV